MGVPCSKRWDGNHLGHRPASVKGECQAKHLLTETYALIISCLHWERGGVSELKMELDATPKHQERPPKRKKRSQRRAPRRDWFWWLIKWLDNAPKCFPINWWKMNLDKIKQGLLGKSNTCWEVIGSSPLERPTKCNDVINILLAVTVTNITSSKSGVERSYRVVN